MKTRMLAAALVTFLGAACGQTIVVVQCDGHTEDKDAQGGSDREVQADGSGGADAMADAGPSADGGMGNDADVVPDGGPSCARYCLRGVTASSIRVSTRETVMLSVMVDNPSATVLSYSVDPAAITVSRPPERPAAVLSELSVSYTVDASSGAAIFRLEDVPPWFLSTTFELAISAKGPAANDPITTASTRVTVRGNALYSGTPNASYKVFALASDGRPATATIPSLMHGELLSTLIRQPRALLLRKNGKLLVYDQSLTPPGILEFELTGHDQQTGSFSVRDAQNMPLFDASSSAPYAIAELQDGRIAMVDTISGRNPTSRLVLFKSDGTLDRIIPASAPDTNWASVGVRENGELLLAVRNNAQSRIERYDPGTGLRLMPDFIENLPNTIRAVLGVAGGGAYAAGDGYVLLLGPTGSRSNVSTLPGSSTTYWRVLAPYEQGRIIAGNDEYSDTDGLDIIEGRTWLRSLRAMGVGNQATPIFGAAFLE